MNILEWGWLYVNNEIGLSLRILLQKLQYEEDLFLLAEEIWHYRFYSIHKMPQEASKARSKEAPPKGRAKERTAGMGLLLCGPDQRVIARDEVTGI